MTPPSDPATTPGEGYSHVKAYGDVPPKWVAFSPKILRHGSHFVQKKPLEEGPISQKFSANKMKFEVEKPLKNRSRFAIIWEKTVKSAVFFFNQPFFEGEKEKPSDKGN